jgi:hypothetical protein
MSRFSDNCVTFEVQRVHPNHCQYYQNENRDLTFSSINTNLSCDRSPLNMKTPKPMRLRASRFLTDRYAYRAQPNYLFELVAFAIIVVTAIWPIFLLANALATTLR